MNTLNLKIAFRLLLPLLAILPAVAADDLPGGDPKARLLDSGVEEIVFAVREDGKDGHWYANFSYYAFDENEPVYGKGGRLCKWNVRTGELTVLIDDPEGTVRDPVIHYDAEKILFSWRKAGTETFHLYECGIDGKNIRRLTDGKFDDIEPCYLPDGGIIFVSARAKRWVNCWLTPVATIYRCDADGANIRQLSANIEHDNTPWVLPDGRILYQRWEYVDRSQVHFHHFWTMNPDGTGQMVYYGNMEPGQLFIDGKPIPGTDKILFINSPGHGKREHTGAVAIVSDRLGPDNPKGLMNIAPEPEFRDPWPVSRNFFIAAKNRAIVALDTSGKETPIYALPAGFENVNLQEPRPVIRRARESIIPSRIDPKRSTGRLVLNDVYIGRNMTGVERGDIKKLLVLEALPKPINFTGGMDPLTFGGSFTLERVLGTIPVEEDGSAYMELPANRALFFVALDEHNNSVKRMQSFLSVRPGEVTSCVGCHEQRPSTAVVQPDFLMALKHPPHTPEPIPDIPDVFDFPRDIQPILDRHCVECHNPDQRDGGVTLAGDRGPMFSHSYVSLTLTQQVADGRNRPQSNYAPRTLGTSASPLMKKLNGEHYGAQLSPHEQDMIRYWIETAACYPGTYAALGHGSIGGYQKNKLIETDDGWPTAKPFVEALERRCTSCHHKKKQNPIPKNLSDEIGLSFWKFDVKDERFQFSRHLVFNLTQPEKSVMLRSPLASEAGGLGLCGPPVFNSTQDPDYQAMLAHITAAKAYLENDLTRFDMPHFKPRREYFREMKRYGILPPGFDPAKDKFDVYQLDRLYWQSLHYKPPTQAMR